MGYIENGYIESRGINMPEKIGECQCLYPDQKDNLLVALDIAEDKYKDIVESIRKNEEPYRSSGIDPHTLAAANIGIMAKFADTRNKIKDIPICK